MQLQSASFQKFPVLLLSESGRVGERKPALLDRLTAVEREYVIKQCTPQLAKRHSTIFRQGELQRGIFLVLSGGVRVFYVAPSGREITRAYWFANNFIGGPDVFGKTPNMWSAIAVRDTSMLYLPSPTLQKLCIQIPNLALGLIDAMVFKGRCYSAMAQMLGTRSAAQRLHQILVHLAEMYGIPSDDGIAIDIPITHEEIAHIIGATRQWVTMSIKRLQTSGIIQSRRGNLIIQDFESLNAKAA